MKSPGYSKAVVAAAERSLERLREFREHIVLIGGYAVRAYAQAEETHDADILVDPTGLAILKGTFPVERNERLKKFQIRLPDAADIDVYVVGISRLGSVDLAAAFRDSVKTADGFRVVPFERLLELKFTAMEDRKGSAAGQKDMKDIFCLLRDRPSGIGLQGDLWKRVQDFLSNRAALAAAGISEAERQKVVRGFKGLTKKKSSIE